MSAHHSRASRITAKADLLELAAKQYAHGAAPFADVLEAALEYADAVRTAPLVRGLKGRRPDENNDEDKETGT